ncbi:MAG: hypothetical protein EOL97_08970 [Spirochaetia bacterium]|nr:hypothetical protein [Spirochaetia bacterium]
MSTEAYFNMTDDDLSLYLAANAGEYIEDPFAISVLKYGPAKNNENVYNDYEDEEIDDLLSIDFETKITDEDFINFDELEV